MAGAPQALHPAVDRLVRRHVPLPPVLELLQGHRAVAVFIELGVEVVDALLAEQVAERRADLLQLFRREVAAVFNIKLLEDLAAVGRLVPPGGVALQGALHRRESHAARDLREREPRRYVSRRSLGAAHVVEAVGVG